MKVLITGSNGFIGKNLSTYLKERNYEVITFNRNDDDLFERISQSDYIFHLAGVNRPTDPADFQSINVGLTENIIQGIKKAKKNIPIIFTSSTQALLDNPYGKSKKEAEERLITFHKQSNNDVFIFRLPGVFGKWSKPYYNTVVATFIHQVLKNEELIITDPKKRLELVYIEDLMHQMMKILDDNSNDNFIHLENTFQISLDKLAAIIKGFKEKEIQMMVPDLGNIIEKKLYSTYISMKNASNLITNASMHQDVRGSFTELIKAISSGQISVNITKPKIEKGNHYHHHKHEKFIVVSGLGEIQLRKINTNDINTFYVTGEKIQLVDIPPGYVHSIKNVGKNDLITIMWANEIFDPNNPDTIYERVKI